MKIRGKLVTGFSLILCIVVGLGIYVGLTMSFINKQSKIITDKDLPSINISQKINSLIQSIRIKEYNHVSASKVEDMQSQEVLIEEIKTQLADSFEEYRKYELSPHEEEALNTIQSELEQYVVLTEQVIQYSREYKNDEARNVMVNESKMLYDTMSQQLTELVEYNVAEAQKKKTRGDEMFGMSLKILSAIILFSIVLSLGIGIFLLRSIIRPIKLLQKELDILASRGGDLTKTIDITNKDEIGELASTVNKFLANTREIIKQVGMASETMNAKAKELNQITDEVKESSELISATMQEMAAGAEEQASSSSEIASSVGLLDDLIKQTNLEGRELDDLSLVVLNETNNGFGQMKTSMETMEEINEVVRDSVKKVQNFNQNSQEISRLVEVINSIAQQTNLLSLNAAIEAARAGEHGRGFAVVADEVRSLSQEVASSVVEITNIVKNIQKESDSVMVSLEAGYQQVEEGTKQISLTEKSFAHINEEVEEMIHKIRLVTKNLEQASINSKKINEAVEQVSAIAEENSASLEESSAAIQQQNGSMEIVASNTQVLSNLADELKATVGKFKV